MVCECTKLVEKHLIEQHLIYTHSNLLRQKMHIYIYMHMVFLNMRVIYIYRFYKYIYVCVAFKFFQHVAFNRSQEPPDWTVAQLEPFVDLVNKAIRKGLYVPDPAIPVQVKPCRKTFEQLRSNLGLA